MNTQYQDHGTLTADGAGPWVIVRSWATLSAHFDSGSATITWEFMGPDGVARGIYSGSNNTTLQAFTATHMCNCFFAGDVSVRPVLSNGSTPVVDWQVMGNLRGEPGLVGK